MGQVLIEVESTQSLLLTPMLGVSSLATATGFIVNHKDRPYLVTNWHVVSGRRADDGQALDSRTGALPDRLAIRHNAAGAIGTWVERIEPTVNADGEPIWLEHPMHGRTVDVICLPLTEQSGIALQPYPAAPSQAKVKLSPGDGVSVVGFPLGLTAGLSFAIWVKGWVASEPKYDFDGLPCFLIDSRTRQGQSGSPVIAHFPQAGRVIFEGDAWLSGQGSYTELLGVYSGRLSEESDLGRVWKMSVVAEIIEGGRLGNGAFQP
jgi:S1-C subfamily serine protease